MVSPFSQNLHGTYEPHAPTLGRPMIAVFYLHPTLVQILLTTDMLKHYIFSHLYSNRKTMDRAIQI